MVRFDVNACFGHWPYWALPGHAPDDLVRAMDRCGIDRAACMSLRGMCADWRVGHAETLDAARRFPDRLVPVATMSPFLDGSARELERQLDEGMAAVRLYPQFHNYRLDAAFVDDICEAAAGRDVPVIIPTRPMMNWRFRTLDIDYVGTVVERHPQTAFILSGPNYLVEFDAAVRLMTRSANVSIETACLQGFDSLRKLVALVGAERVLFGTGALLHYPACNVAKLDGAEITPDEREAIASGNALRLLGRAS